MHLTFVGLGSMGTGMARNLLREGHQVTLYNRTRDKADKLAAEAGAGASVAESVREAAVGSEAVITMLADDQAVEQTVFDPDQGLAPLLPVGGVHISCSTISIRLARRLAEEHATRNQTFLSCPVFGRPEAAAAKKLLVIAAGNSSTIERFRPVFDSIGRQTFLAGNEPWQANVVKLCGNFMISSVIEAFGEANAALRKSSVDPHLFLEVMNALFGSPVYANYGKLIADEAFEPAGFALRLGLKDLRLVLEMAVDCQTPMPFASVIRDHMLSGLAHNQGDQDWSSLVRSAARSAGL